MEEHAAMCEKILRKLEQILSTNPGIQEFAVVPTPENDKNKTPVLYEQNCLGLESWCKKYILQYTHSVLIKNRKALLCNQLLIVDMKNLNHILIGALLIQPNISTFWNMKRELVKNETLSVEQEMNFSRIVLTQHSKCSEIFSFRKWLIHMAIFKENNLHILADELNICELAAEKSKNNYHAWTHRIWCIEKVSEVYSDLDGIILSELNFSLNWITKHVSEYTGYYYRQTVIKKLNNLKSVSCSVFQNFDFKDIVKYLKLPTVCNDAFHGLQYLMGKSNLFPILEDCPKYVNMLSLLLNDLNYVSTELNFLYKGHECLWNYHRFLVVNIMKLLYEYHGVEFCYQLHIRNECISSYTSTNMLSLDTNIVSGVKTDILRKITSSNLYNILIKHELEFIEANKNTENAVQNDLALRHFKWLKCTNFYND